MTAVFQSSRFQLLLCLVFSLIFDFRTTQICKFITSCTMKPESKKNRSKSTNKSEGNTASSSCYDLTALSNALDDQEPANNNKDKSSFDFSNISEALNTHLISKSNAHNKHDIWRDLESRSIISIKLKHGPSCSSRSSTTCCPPPAHACSCCCTSSWGSSSTYRHFCKIPTK